MGFRSRPGATEFAEAVHAFVQAVPAGRVTTYADVALAIGHPGASRAVGTVMRFNDDTDRTPCHRVVKSDGTVGWYGGGPGHTAKKMALLRREGIRVARDGRILDFGRVRFRRA